MGWSDSDWKNRLREGLEPLLKSPKLVAEISKYQGAPFALFSYPPTAEREFRKEMDMLATRVQNETPKNVHRISMANLLWEAFDQVQGPDGTMLYDSERSIADMEPRERLSQITEQVGSILTDVAPLVGRIEQVATTLDPEQNVIFLWRVGALYPAYRASALLDNLVRKVTVPTVLFYPGTRAGVNSLRFMDSLDAIHSYRHKIF